MAQVIKEALQTLFDNYIQTGGSGICYFGEIARRNNMQPYELGNELKYRRLVKDPQFLPTDFGATISRYGIEAINSSYINDKRQKIVSTLGINGNDWSSILETLDLEPAQSQMANDIAHWLSDDRIIECQYRGADVIIRLTHLGQELYEQGKAEFLNL